MNQLSRAMRNSISHEDIDLSRLTVEIMKELKRTKSERNRVIDVAQGVMVNADRTLYWLIIKTAMN